MRHKSSCFPAMRVLYLTNNADRASTTVGTEGWIRNLAPLGLRAVVASPKLGEFAGRLREMDIPVYKSGFPFPDKWRPWRFCGELLRLARIARRHRVQLVHCNEEDTYPFGNYVARLAGVPCVLTCHFNVARDFCRWAFSGRRRPARVFFVSQRSRENCLSALSGIVDPDRCQVVHNGLDMRSYGVSSQLRSEFRRQIGAADGEILVGVACAFRERKQIEHLVEAIVRLDSPNVRLVLAGFPVADEEQYASALLEKAHTALGSRLAYIGCLKDLRPLGNGLDLYVNTSREETFGMSVLEAMACGCPVVGYDSKAVDEVVLPIGGEIVPQDDIQALTEAIGRWCRRVDLRDGPRLSARRQAERFDLERISQRTWSEYAAVLGGTVA